SHLFGRKVDGRLSSRLTARRLTKGASGQESERRAGHGRGCDQEAHEYLLLLKGIRFLLQGELLGPRLRVASPLSANLSAGSRHWTALTGSGKRSESVLPRHMLLPGRAAKDL